MPIMYKLVGLSPSTGRLVVTFRHPIEQYGELANVVHFDRNGNIVLRKGLIMEEEWVREEDIVRELAA